MKNFKKSMLYVLILAIVTLVAAPIFADHPGDELNEIQLWVEEDDWAKYAAGAPLFKGLVKIEGVSNQTITAKLITNKNSVGAGSIVVNNNEITYIPSGKELSGKGNFKGFLEVRSVADPSICRRYKFSINLEEGCVQAGTHVSMADGSKKAIEAVSPGDRIVAFDAEAKNIAEATVQKVLVHDDVTYILHELIPEGGESLLATGNHPIRTKDSGWQQVDSLKAGDVIYHYDGQKGILVEMKIASIVRDRSEKGIVYNLKTSRGNYIANDILIHNKCLKKGSLVETPSGSRAIESLSPGDLVLGNVNGSKVPVRVTNVYSKETVLSEIPGKHLGSNLTATINHTLLQGDAKIKVGATNYPDEVVSGTVFDIRTESLNYYAGGMLLQGGD